MDEFQHPTREQARNMLRACPDNLEKIKEWNDYRKKHPEWKPDLSDQQDPADFKGLDLSIHDGRSLPLTPISLSYANLISADLSGAHLPMANLSVANLSIANLSRTDLSGANLTGADFTYAGLSGANLTGADFTYAGLSGANLTGANLRKADFSEANLIDVAFAGADLSSAYLGHTTFGGVVNLASAQGLDSVSFGGPSTISHQTLAASRSRIPESFLRGCGLAPWEILSAKMYDPALTATEINDIQYQIFEQRTKALQIAGVFISYSHANADFVDKMRERLTEKGASVWLDRHDFVAGSLQKQIDRALRINDVVLLVLSEASIESDWVEHELKAARRKEKEQKRDVLCPVALDDSWKDKVFKNPDVHWEHLGEKNVLDFSDWQTPATFDEQFQKLLKGIQLYYGAAPVTPDSGQTPASKP